jgi:hypothetical protein
MKDGSKSSPNFNPFFISQNKEKALNFNPRKIKDLKNKK